jgi:hypothetical protein
MIKASILGISVSDNNLGVHGIFEVGYPINPNLSIVGQFKYANIFSDPSTSVIYGTVGVVYSLAKASE